MYIHIYRKCILICICLYNQICTGLCLCCYTSICMYKCLCKFVNAHGMNSTCVCSIYRTSKCFYILRLSSFQWLRSLLTLLAMTQAQTSQKTHSPTKENRHEQLEHRSNTGDNCPEAAALAHILSVYRYVWRIWKSRKTNWASKHWKRDLMIYHKTTMSSITAERMACLTSICLWRDWNKVSTVLIIITLWFHTEKYCQMLGE